MKEKRSPIKEGELQRLPGAYLREKFDDTVDDFMPWFATALFAFTLTALEWLFYFIHVQRSPWVPTSLLFIVLFLTYRRYKVFKKNAHNYRQGYEGEMLVGQILEGLRGSGFVPLHDVPCEQNGNKFNIDHVIIGTKGIFAVETKTWSKEGVHNAIDYANEGLLKNGVALGAEVIIQAKLNGKWLKELLQNRMAENFEVLPILTFPGWWVEPSANKFAKERYGVLILSPKAIGKYLDGYPEILTKEQAGRIVAVLSSYVHEVASGEEE